MNIENVYIIDKLENIGNYAHLNAGFAKAAALIAKGDFAALKSGRNEIDGENVWVNCVSAQLVAPKDRKPELHRKYFDLHVPLAGPETFGLGIFDSLARGSFDEKEDIGFYDQKVEWLTIVPGEFLITYPNTCAHAPACTLAEPHESKKLIFKIKA